MTKNEEVYQDLREKILNGYYAPSSPLESEAVLSKRYGVSKPTLQKAISRLKQDGFLHSRQGSGTFVNPPEFFKKDSLTTLSERFKGTGAVISSKVLLVEDVPCGERAETLHIAADETLIHYRRLRLVDGRPHALEDTYMPRYLFDGFSEEVLAGSMIHYIEEVCGYKISHDIKRIHPVLPTAEQSGLLDADSSKPLLQIDHMVYLVKSVIVQYTEELTLDQDVCVTQVR